MSRVIYDEESTSDSDEAAVGIGTKEDSSDSSDFEMDPEARKSLLKTNGMQSMDIGSSSDSSDIEINPEMRQRLLAICGIPKASALEVPTVFCTPRLDKGVEGAIEMLDRCLSRFAHKPTTNGMTLMERPDGISNKYQLNLNPGPNNNK